MFEKDCDEAGAILRYRRKREGQKIDFKQKADLKILFRNKLLYILLVTDGLRKCGNSGNPGEGSYTDRGNLRAGNQE